MLALGGAGCVGTPVPQPPALDPPDPDRIAYEMVGTFSELVGGPGAALPGTVLWGVNLDDAFDPQTTVVEADGSFNLGLFAAPGDELRVQTRDGDERSRPVDLRVPRGEVVRPTAGCLTLEPALELVLEPVEVGAPATGEVRVSNGCAGDAVIDGVALRRASDAWTVTTPGPLTVPPGGSVEVRLTFQPSTPGLHEEILLLQVSAPEADRRPLTLSGEAR